MLHAGTFILLFKDAGAVAYQAGFMLDACGSYILFRYLIRNQEDLLRVTKVLALVAVSLAICMGYEYLTHVNVFSYISSSPIVPWIRNGKVRAQGIFANSITAGVFGATLFPLFYWLVKNRKTRLFGAFGIAASSVIAVTSMSSTAILAYIAAILALFLWPFRSYARQIRWGILFTVLALALVMKAPVWFIIARVDFVGGHAWDRAALIDAAVRHFSDWWLLGTKSNASWGADTWDACNQFVYEATSGGLATCIAFISILSFAFGCIGKARKRVEGIRNQEWFFWCMGAALFAHVIGFWGVDYFDVIRIWWYVFLAMITAATTVTKAPVAKELKPAYGGQSKYAFSTLTLF
jgi:hypothetical protein